MIVSVHCDGTLLLQSIRKAVRACNTKPCIYCHLLGNEILLYSFLCISKISKIHTALLRFKHYGTKTCIVCSDCILFLSLLSLEEMGGDIGGRHCCVIL